MFNFVKIRALVFLILILSCAISCKSNDAFLKQKQKVSDAAQLLDGWSGQRVKLREAKALIDEELKENPENIYALKELSRYYIMDGYLRGETFKPGSLENAEKTIIKAIGIKPDFAEGYVLLGHIYETLDNIPAAEVALTKAEKLGTDDPWLHLNWAAVLDKQNKTEEMKKRYMQVINSNTKNIKALSNAYSFLITESEEAKDYENVSHYYHKIFELRPENAWMRGNYADFLRNEVGDFDAAVLSAREALKIMNYGVGRRILGVTLLAKWGDELDKGMKPEEAEAIFEEAVYYYSNLSEALVRLGAFETTFPTVKYLLKKGVPINGSHRSGYTALSWAAKYGKKELVLKLLKMGVDPDIPVKGGHTALTMAISNGHTATALALLEHDVNPAPDTTHLNALRLAKMKNNVEVIRMIEKVLSN